MRLVRVVRRMAGASLVGVCLLLTGGCRSRAPVDWRPVVRTVDSLVSRGDTTAAFETIRVFLGKYSSRTPQNSDTAYAAIADTLAQLMSRMGDPRLAERLYRLALREVPAIEPDITAHVYLLCGLGSTLAYLGQMLEARQALDSCFADCQAHGLDRDPVFADVLSAAGHLRYVNSAFTEAATFWEQARALRQRLLSADDPQIADVQSNLGMAYAALNEADSAEANYLRALRTLEHWRPQRDHAWIAAAINLASLYADYGRYSEALKYYRRAMSITEETLGSRHPLAADLLLNMATIDYDLGDWNGALGKLRQSATIYRESRVPHLGARKCEYNLALLFYREQQWDSAEAHAQLSMALIKAGLGEGNPEESGPRDLLSQIHLVRREWEAAREDQRSAYRLARGQFLSQYLTLSESEGISYSQEFREQTWDYLTILLRCEDKPVEGNRDIAEIVLSAKSLVQDAALMRQRLLRKQASTLLDSKLDSLRSMRTRSAQLALSLAKLPASKAMQTELSALREQSARLEKAVMAKTPLHREYTDAPLDSIYSALRRLPSDAMVVDYLAFGFRGEDDSSKLHYLAIVLRDTGLVACVHLGAADAIDRSIQVYRDYLSQPQTTSASQIDRVSRAVYESLWRPVERYVTTARLVLICPDGEINTVSFAGLPDENGHYLIERHALQYLSTTRDLVRLSADPPPAGRGILLLGNPDYRGQLPELKHAQQELLGAGESWKAAFAEPVDILIGEAASEYNFRRSYPGKKAMYIAAHSTEIPAMVDSSAFSGSAVQDLLRNGMVLADYRVPDGNFQDPNQDGILTADEISALNCDGVGLAVLSLCESGGGTVISGEGVYGLRRAFQTAGVQTVISTLWPVDDLATAELMKHGLFDTTLTYPENLQKVCLARIADLRKRGETPNPYGWAAFVCSGNWRR